MQGVAGLLFQFVNATSKNKFHMANNNEEGERENTVHLECSISVTAS